MHVRRVGRSLRHTGYNFGTLALQLIHARLHLALIQTVFNCRHDACNGAADLLQRFLVGLRLRAAFVVQAIALFMIRPDRRCHCVR